MAIYQGTPPTGTAAYTCPWCQIQSEASGVSCPHCGAPVDVRRVQTRSGWSELPPIKDMARIQCGASTCQIEGTLVPVADFNLAPGDGVYFSHHVLLWKDMGVQISAMSLAGGWKRLFAGLPLVMTQAHGPGHVALSVDKVGETIAVPLQPGHSLVVREHVFMAANLGLGYTWTPADVWFKTQDGDDYEMHYPIGMFLDVFQAQQAPGLLLLHAAGNVFVRTLAAGETILIKPTAFLYREASVRAQLHIEKPAGTWRSWRSWGDRYLWMRLHGPGRVAVESAFAHFEDPGRNIVDMSWATEQAWW